jgi:hypothetical protein
MTSTLIGAVTAAELIEYLKGLPPETPVFTYDADHCIYPIGKPILRKVAVWDLVEHVNPRGEKEMIYDRDSLRYVDAIALDCQ